MQSFFFSCWLYINVLLPNIVCKHFFLFEYILVSGRDFFSKKFMIWVALKVVCSSPGIHNLIEWVLGSEGPRRSELWADLRLEGATLLKTSRFVWRGGTLFKLTGKQFTINWKRNVNVSSFHGVLRNDFWYAFVLHLRAVALFNEELLANIIFSSFVGERSLSVVCWTEHLLSIVSEWIVAQMSVTVG